MAAGRTVEEYCNQVHQLAATYPDEVYIAMKQTPLSKELVPNIRIRRTAGKRPLVVHANLKNQPKNPACEVEFRRRFSTDLA
jgi:hypothetical protein